MEEEHEEQSSTYIVRDPKRIRLLREWKWLTMALCRPHRLEWNISGRWLNLLIVRH